MPAIAKEVQQYHLALIRSLISEEHQITFEEIMQQLVTRYGLSFHRSYVTRLSKKIFAERARRADRKTLNVALATFEDTTNVVVKKAWEIANNERSNAVARVNALRLIQDAHSRVYEMLFDAGVFERKLGTIELAVRNTPLPEDRKKAIEAAFVNWGLAAAPAEQPKALAAPETQVEPTTQDAGTAITASEAAA